MEIQGIKERGVTLALVKRYSERYSDIEFQELLAIASLAAVQAERNWKPDRGMKRSSYVHRAVNSELYKQIVWQQAPVHGSCHCKRELRALHATGFDEDTCSPDNVEISIEELIDRARVYRKIHDHILSRPAGRAAMGVILGGKTVAETSNETGVAPKEIRRATREARQAIRDDDEIAAFAQGVS
jgi:hypothetical protein